MTSHGTRFALSLVTLALLAGCRLSAPVYAFKSLKAGDQRWPEESLIFGRIIFDGALTTADAEGVFLKRIDRFSGTSTFYATENTIYRVFQRRAVKDGYFAINVAPGVYELDELESAFLWQTQRYQFNPADRRASRLYVTRPGIYDLGTFFVRIKDFRHVLDRAQSAADYDQVRKQVVDGTRWEQFLPTTTSHAIQDDEK